MRSSPRRTTTATRRSLVRLEVVDPEELAELLEEAWRLRAPKRAIAAYDASR